MTQTAYTVLLAAMTMVVVSNFVMTITLVRLRRVVDFLIENIEVTVESGAVTPVEEEAPIVETVDLFGPNPPVFRPSKKWPWTGTEMVVPPHKPPPGAQS